MWVLCHRQWIIWERTFESKSMRNFCCWGRLWGTDCWWQHLVKNTENERLKWSVFSCLKADGYLLRASLSKKFGINAIFSTPSQSPFLPLWSFPQEASKRHHKRKAVGHTWVSAELIPINLRVAQRPSWWAHDQRCLACWGMLTRSTGQDTLAMFRAAHCMPLVHPAHASSFLELSSANSSVWTLWKTVPSNTASRSTAAE